MPLLAVADAANLAVCLTETFWLGNRLVAEFESSDENFLASYWVPNMDSFLVI